MTAQANFEFHPSFRNAREKSPKFFLFTQEESERIGLAYTIIQETLMQYAAPIDESAPLDGIAWTHETIGQMREEALANLEKRGLPRAELIRLYDKLQQSETWTYLITGKDESGRRIYSYESSDPEFNGIIRFDTIPEFFDENTTIKKQAESLGVPEGMLFVAGTELFQLNEINNIIAAPATAEQGEAAIIEAASVALSLGGRKIKKTRFPLDVISNYLTKAKPGASENLRTSPESKKKKVHVYFMYGSDESTSVSIGKISDYDKRLLNALHTSYCEGITTPSIGEVYYQMGYNGSPNTRDADKIVNHALALSRTPYTISNKEEIEADYNYPEVELKGNLLSIKIIKIRLNGKTAQAIQMTDEPPLGWFSRIRKQFTFYDRAVLDSPLNKTEQNLGIENYLLQTIAMRRNRSKLNVAKFTILLETLYEKAGITEKKQIQRTPDKLLKLLEHYKKTNVIQDYKLEKDKIRISCLGKTSDKLS